MGNCSGAGLTHGGVTDQGAQQLLLRQGNGETCQQLLTSHGHCQSNPGHPSACKKVAWGAPVTRAGRQTVSQGMTQQLVREGC